MIKNRYSLGLHVSTCGTVILGSLPAQQITRIGGLLQRAKKVDWLPTLVDKVYLKSKENLYKKNIDFINLKTNFYQLALSAIQAVVFD